MGFIMKFTTLLVEILKFSLIYLLVDRTVDFIWDNIKGRKR